MKIIGLKVNGLRTLLAAELAIKENGLTAIKGKNRAGKTSILDALEILFQGNTHVESDMISHGAEKMTIEGTVIGDQGEKYVVKKNITNKSARLEITDEKGFSMSKKPQEFLTSLISELSFNPRKFLELEGDKKLKEMMQLLKLDFTSLDKKIKDKEQERLLVGREVKQMGDVVLGEEVVKVYVTAVVKRKTEIQERNDALKKGHELNVRQIQQDNIDFNAVQVQRKGDWDKTVEVISKAETRIAEIQKQIEALQAEQGRHDKLIQETQKSQSLLPVAESPVDIYTFNKPQEPDYDSVAELDQQLITASDTNAKALEYEQRKDKIKVKMEKESSYNKLTEEIESLRSDKITILKDAPMPLPGLEIKLIPGEEEKYGLFYGDTYSENWSEAEGLVIASQICLSQNPKLRAVFLDKGESMDSETLQKYAKWAEDNDMQAVITIVADVPEKEDMDDNTWYIIEGKLETKNSDPQPSGNPGELALD